MWSTYCWSICAAVENWWWHREQVREWLLGCTDLELGRDARPRPDEEDGWDCDVGRRELEPGAMEECRPISSEWPSGPGSFKMYEMSCFWDDCSFRVDLPEGFLDGLELFPFWSICNWNGSLVCDAFLLKFCWRSKLRRYVKCTKLDEWTVSARQRWQECKTQPIDGKKQRIVDSDAKPWSALEFLKTKWKL